MRSRKNNREGRAELFPPESVYPIDLVRIIFVRIDLFRIIFVRINSARIDLERIELVLINLILIISYLWL